MLGSLVDVNGILAREGLFRRPGQIAGLGLGADRTFPKVQQIVASRGRVVLQTEFEFVFPSHQ